MKLSEELSWRGFVNQMTFSSIEDIDEPRTFYFGVDPSADSMQIGNLAAAMMCRHFINHGHKAILLVGGATGMIGDPDGKKQERELNSVEVVEKNKKAIAAQYRRVFDGQDFEVVDNYDWFKDINYLDFLRDIGKKTSLTQMLDREFVQSRIGEGGAGISYAEFSYSLIQGYDFLHLFQGKGATLQVCGADQWGNSIAGVDLIRRVTGNQAHVYSTPLIVNKTTGVKFGKSEDGAIWLDEGKTSVFKFYQFWLNVDDAGVIDYLKVFTLLSPKEIETIALEHAKNPGARHAQRALADAVTELVHGADRSASAAKVTSVLFGGKSFSTLDDRDIMLLANEIETVSVGTTIVGALVEADIAKSNGDARRLISGGGISLNGQKVTEDMQITEKSLVKKGKNSFILVR